MKKIIPSQRLAFVLITSLFFLWGLANNMTDTLLAAFKKIMSMSDFQTSWIQIAFYGSYFCLAIPSAILIKKYSYKSGILIGLGLAVMGALLFYPASISMVYGHFLFALFIFAGGLAVLETTANPYIFELGPLNSAVRRLNLAQSFNPIGSIMGVLLSKYFILSHLNQASAEERASMDSAALFEIQKAELSAVMGPYVGIALVMLLIWLIIYYLKMPDGKDTGKELQLKSGFRRLMANQNYRTGVIAQFFYVGAQIGVWSFTIRYVMLELGLNEAEAATYYLYAIVLFMVTRFINTYLMGFFVPKKLLVFFAVLAMLLCLSVIYSGGMPGVVSLVLISLCMSLMFPTIYGLSIRGLGKDTKLGGSGLVMAILGGAVLTSIQGLVSDFTGSIALSFWVPFSCFFVVLIFGWRSKEMTEEAGLL
ncbi:L-fucose:H+ symporter permease [Cecembia sp.]|uniref:L-fucose:H+ symporter permease n=1 Tax=Cecembia sp. TaxID=1898110 RepID=UPI0025C32F15|nr:L-fucose:H+ symporter permease [Cecembia sp.]